VPRERLLQEQKKAEQQWRMGKQLVLSSSSSELGGGNQSQLGFNHTVRRHDQLDHLLKSDCDQGQGYLFHKPLSAEAFKALFD